MSYEDAFVLLKKARPAIQPNRGFVAQLKRYAQLLDNGK